MSSNTLRVQFMSWKSVHEKCCHLLGSSRFLLNTVSKTGCETRQKGVIQFKMLERKTTVAQCGYPSIKSMKYLKKKREFETSFNPMNKTLNSQNNLVNIFFYLFNIYVKKATAHFFLNFFGLFSFVVFALDNPSIFYCFSSFRTFPLFVH